MKGPGFKLRSIRLQSLSAASVTEALASAGLLGDTTQRDTRNRVPGGGGWAPFSGAGAGAGWVPAQPTRTRSQLLGHCLPGVTWLTDMPLELPASSGAFRTRWLPP